MTDHPPHSSKDGGEIEAGGLSKELQRVRDEARRGLSAEMLQLSAFDDALLEALGNGGIRFLRADWLRRQPPEYRIQRRQELEALEKAGASPSPLLSPAEAIAAICAADGFAPPPGGGAAKLNVKLPGAAGAAAPPSSNSLSPAGIACRDASRLAGHHPPATNTSSVAI